MPVKIRTTEFTCWYCKNVTNTVTWLDFKVGRVLSGCCDIYVSIDALPNGRAVVMSLLSVSLLRRYGIRVHKPLEKELCFHCHTFQELRPYRSVRYRYNNFDFEIKVKFKTEWGSALTEHYKSLTTSARSKSSIYYWWFDESISEQDFSKMLIRASSSKMLLLAQERQAVQI